MIFLKIKTFIKALLWHIRLGLPKSSNEEIQRRYNICQGCELFDKVKSQCLHCGCRITQKREFFNKLAWADQKCPVGKW